MQYYTNIWVKFIDLSFQYAFIYLLKRANTDGMETKPLNKNN